MKLFLVKLLGKLLTKTVYDITEFADDKKISFITTSGTTKKQLKEWNLYKYIDFKALKYSQNGVVFINARKSYKIKAILLPTYVGRLWIKIRRVCY